jgi:hypothetical protein
MNDDWALFPDRCDHCGRTFEPDVRYPTVTEDRPNGDLQIYTFCEESCKTAWLSAREE